VKNFVIRKATEEDRFQISLVIAYGFEKDFAFLNKDMNKIAKAIQNGIHIDKFYVAVLEDAIIGVTACTDCYGRAIDIDKKAYRKYFGIIKGLIATKVMKEEFMKPLNYSETTGYIECATVDISHRRKGIAEAMINYILKNLKYNEYVLDVTDINNSAIRCYEKIGFEEFERIKEKYGKQKGFNEKKYMKYKKY